MAANTDLSTPEVLLLQRWKSIDFTTWNEAEVREGFVIDLLHTLGYRKGTTFDLEMEKPLKLSQPFHRIGRKKVDIDYAPSVRKKYFWIVEAKPGKQQAMDVGDLLQVHLYAIHPEIQARLVVLTNGWQLRVYDALTLSSFDDALLVVNQSDAESNFVELREMLGAARMHQFQRKRMLEVIRGTLEAEVDKDAFQQLAGELNRLVADGRKLIENNARELWMAAMRDRFAEEEKELRSASLNILYVRMDNPGDGRPASALEFVRRVKEATPDEQGRLVDWLAMHYRGRPHNIFKVLSLHALVELATAGIEVPKSAYVTSVVGCINELARANIGYWQGSSVCGPLCHLDNAACRVAMKLCIRVGSEAFEHVVQSWKQCLTPQELAAVAPSLDGIVASSANHLHEILWQWFCSGASKEAIWQGIWDIHAIEAELDKLPPRPRSGQLDFYGVQYLGLSWDQLRVGTWNVLRERPGVSAVTGIDQGVLEFIGKSREQVIAETPREAVAPVEYRPRKTMNDALAALGTVIKLRVLATVGQKVAEGTGNPIGP